MLSFFPRGVLDEILNLIESVSEGFPSFSILLLDSSRIKNAVEELLPSPTLNPFIVSGCVDEPLISEDLKHDVPVEFKTDEVLTYNYNLLFGDKVTVIDYYGYVEVGVKSDLSPVEFANKIITEVTATVQGAPYVEVGFYTPGTNMFHSFVRTIPLGTQDWNKNESRFIESTLSERISFDPILFQYCFNAVCLLEY